MDTAIIQVGVAGETLPSLVDRAARALAGARSSAEVLEARDLAGFAYDTAKRTARLAQAKGAHDTLIAAAHRAQADALLIESNAKRRLADEYDAAVDRGEAMSPGRPEKVADEDHKITLADIGLPKQRLAEARQIRDAEDRDPGIVERTLNDAIARGDEPTRAEVKRAINGREDVIERAAKEEAAMRDKKDFRAIRKAWNASTSTAQRMFRDYIGA
jgi:hypothetical protein